MPNLERGKEYVWEARLPEIKKIVSGGTLVSLPDSNSFTHTFTINGLDNDARLKLSNLIRSMLLDVDYSQNSDPRREIFEMELAVSCAISGWPVEAKTYYLYDGFQKELSPELRSSIEAYDADNDRSEDAEAEAVIDVPPTSEQISVNVSREVNMALFGTPESVEERASRRSTERAARGERLVKSTKKNYQDLVAEYQSEENPIETLIFMQIAGGLYETEFDAFKEAVESLRKEVMGVEDSVDLKGCLMAALEIIKQQRVDSGHQSYAELSAGIRMWEQQEMWRNNPMMKSSSKSGSIQKNGQAENLDQGPAN